MHIKIEGLCSGQFSGTRPTGANLLEQGWKDVGTVFLIATILDVVYQIIVHRGVYMLELLITAVALAIVPYVLFGGPISRIARVVFAARPSVKQRLIR